MEPNNVSQQTVDNAVNNPVIVDSNLKKSNKKPIIILVIFISILLILGVSAAAYNTIVLNNPDKVWEQAIANTKNGYEELNKTVLSNPAKGGEFQAKLTLTEPTIADGVISGEWYESNAMVKADVGISGIRANGEVRLIDNDSSETEVYVKVDGLAGVAPFLSLVQPELASVIAEINGNWYSVDQTTVSSLMGSEKTDDTPPVNEENYTDITNNLKDLIYQRLLTTDNSVAIITREPIGKEDFEGDSTYKYELKIQKQQLDDFLKELSSIVNSSNLGVGGLLDSESINEQLKEVGDLESQINDENIAELKVEAWVDMDLKYFRNIRIYIPDTEESKGSFIDFGLDYEGGDEFPFSVHIVNVTEGIDAGSIDLLLSAKLNKSTKAVEINVDLDITSNDQTVAGSLQLLIKPSDSPIEIEKPTNSKSITELLGSLLGGNSSELNLESETIDLNSEIFKNVEL